MSGTVSTRWFWADWLSDPGLRACGYAARGLWHDMLCIAGTNKESDYGFLTLNGRALQPNDIARMTGGAAPEVETLLIELEQNGVFSRDRRGAIYCRRMVRAQISRRNGRVGGNPKLLEKKRNPDQVIRPSSPEPEPKPVPKENVLSDWPADYREQFWALYPRKVEKKSALTKLDAVRKTSLPWAALIGGVQRYIAFVDGTEERFIKHPTVWLNKGCWDDQSTRRVAEPKAPARNGLMAAARALHEFNEAEDRYGPDAGGLDQRPALPAPSHS